jgi:hypothetical protein
MTPPNLNATLDALSEELALLQSDLRTLAGLAEDLDRIRNRYIIICRTLRTALACDCFNHSCWSCTGAKDLYAKEFGPVL